MNMIPALVKRAPTLGEIDRVAVDVGAYMQTAARVSTCRTVTANPYSGMTTTCEPRVLGECARSA